MSNSSYGKKKNPASALKIKIYNESLSRGKYIYIGKKKEKANFVIPIEKKSKDTQLVGQKKKTPLGLLSYNAKSAQYIYIYIYIYRERERDDQKETELFPIYILFIN